METMRAGAHQSVALEALEDAGILSVSQLNAQIKSLLETAYPFVWVKGEISNFRVPGSGHHYFTLKDEQSQIRAVFFRHQNRRLRFVPESGMQVLCQGRLSVYEPRGEYQLIVEVMEPQGIGALQLAFEQLKKRLEAEGLFDELLKRSLPVCPCKVAVVTSSTGAAVRDILKVLQRSPYPLSVTVMPVRVQGQEAGLEIATAIATANRLQERFQWDVMIVGRGGGSMEDLWPFNEEVVARAIAASEIPVISAVGHEIDFTISDLVADMRAPTPTAAAEWVVSRLDRFQREMTAHRDRMLQVISQRLEGYRQKLRFLERLLVDPKRRLEDLRLMLDERMDRLQMALARRLEMLRTTQAHLTGRLRLVHPARAIQQCRANLDQRRRELALHYGKILDAHRFQLKNTALQLEGTSPLSILGRGYSITCRLPDNVVVRKPEDVQTGSQVRVRLAEGYLECTVNRTGRETVPACERMCHGQEEK